MRIGDGYGGTSEDLPVRARCLVCFGVSGVRNPDFRPDSKARYVGKIGICSMSAFREGTLHPESPSLLGRKE